MIPLDGHIGSAVALVWYIAGLVLIWTGVEALIVAGSATRGFGLLAIGVVLWTLLSRTDRVAGGTA